MTQDITPQLVSTLVEPFLRGTERIRTDHAGVGLGLAIVKSITQAHDGTLTRWDIGVEVGHGRSFVIEDRHAVRDGAICLAKCTMVVGCG